MKHFFSQFAWLMKSTEYIPKGKFPFYSKTSIVKFPFYSKTSIVKFGVKAHPLVYYTDSEMGGGGAFSLNFTEFVVANAHGGVQCTCCT